MIQSCMVRMYFYNDERFQRCIQPLKLLLFFVTIAITTISCIPTEPEVQDPFLTISQDSVKFAAKASLDTIVVKMNGSGWKVTSSDAWCSTSKVISSTKEDQLIISSTNNISRLPRTATLTIVMDGNLSKTIKVSQSVKATFIYPDYSSPIANDSTNMTSNAIALAKNMFVGWNLGNTLEAPKSETAWGNPKTTQLLIDSVKAAGINAIRIPCEWSTYLEDSATCKIKESWLARVKEVVDYCYKNDMYVMINIHYDGGWHNNPTYAKQNAANAKQQALWEQIAVYFRNYDEHLLFAGTNEVSNDGSTSNENIVVQQSYLQTFVDAVRNTGGRNAYRTLIIQSYSTNIDKGVQYMKMPKDQAAKRMMVEFHYYDPYDFCLQDNSTIYLWGASFKQYGAVSSWGQEDWADAQLQKIKTNFVDKGYPAILGEFGALRRTTLAGTTGTNHLASRAYYIKYITQHAKENGFVPFYWDNGYAGNRGFAIFNRGNGTTFDRQTLKAYIEGATAGKYPFK
jgi:endoglucanase